MTMSLCTFRLSGRLFGVEIGLVKEVVEHLRIAMVPHASPDVSGLVNVRSRLYLVVDLRQLFGFDPAPQDQEVKLVLFKPSVDEALGVRVDALGEVIALDPSMVEDRRATEAADGPGSRDERRRARNGLASGVGRTASGLLVLLDPKGILHALRD